MKRPKATYATFWNANTGTVYVGSSTSRSAAEQAEKMKLAYQMARVKTADAVHGKLP